MFMRTLTTAVAATAMLAGTAGSASAATAPPSPASAPSAQSDTVRDVSASEVADYLKRVGAGDLLGKDGHFSYAKAKEAYGADYAKRFQSQWNQHVNGEKPATGAVRASSDESYASCVLKGVGLGGLVGASTAIANAIANHAWKEAGELIVKEAAKRGIKIAIKGGAVGVAGALGGYAVWCATPWAITKPGTAPSPPRAE